MKDLVICFDQLRMTDVSTVGGKNASLGGDDQNRTLRGYNSSSNLRSSSLTLDLQIPDGSHTLSY